MEPLDIDEMLRRRNRQFSLEAPPEDSLQLMGANAQARTLGMGAKNAVDALQSAPPSDALTMASKMGLAQPFAPQQTPMPQFASPVAPFQDRPQMPTPPKPGMLPGGFIGVGLNPTPYGVPFPMPPAAPPAAPPDLLGDNGPTNLGSDRERLYGMTPESSRPAIEPAQIAAQNMGLTSLPPAIQTPAGQTIEKLPTPSLDQVMGQTGFGPAPTDGFVRNISDPSGITSQENWSSDPSTQSGYRMTGNRQVAPTMTDYRQMFLNDLAKEGMQAGQAETGQTGVQGAAQLARQMFGVDLSSPSITPQMRQQIFGAQQQMFGQQQNQGLAREQMQNRLANTQLENEGRLNSIYASMGKMRDGSSPVNERNAELEARDLKMEFDRQLAAAQQETGHAQPTQDDIGVAMKRARDRMSAGTEAYRSIKGGAVPLAPGATTTPSATPQGQPTATPNETVFNEDTVSRLRRSLEGDLSRMAGEYTTADPNDEAGRYDREAGAARAIVNRLSAAGVDDNSLKMLTRNLLQSNVPQDFLKKSLQTGLMENGMQMLSFGNRDSPMLKSDPWGNPLSPGNDRVEFPGGYEVYAGDSLVSNPKVTVPGMGIRPYRGALDSKARAGLSSVRNADLGKYDAARKNSELLIRLLSQLNPQPQ